VLLAFDYDGTLAPIVDEPAAAKMRASTQQRLARVAQLYPCIVISGRAQWDLVKRLRGVDVRELIGNHGADLGWRSERFARDVRRWRRFLAEHLKSQPGVFIEDKALSLAIHYRQSRQKKLSRAAIHEAVAALGDARVIGGDHVVNVLPKDAPHKGFALEKARTRLGCDTAIYVGDDETDEDVFALDQPGRLLTIRIGAKHRSLAAYQLRSQSQIDGLLDVLIKLRSGNGATVKRPMLESDEAATIGRTLDFMRLIWSLDHALHRTSKRMVANLGITGPQRLVLRIVGRFPGISAGQLAQTLYIHPSTLTGIVERLEARRIMVRRVDPRDARRSLLELTAKGRHLDRQRNGTVEAAMQRALAQVSDCELDAARTVLMTIQRTLEQPLADAAQAPARRLSTTMSHP
jgi:trehalose 6-phosphate phosphatase